VTKEDRMGRKSWLSVKFIGQLSLGLTRADTPQFGDLIQQQAMHRRYGADSSAVAGELVQADLLCKPGFPGIGIPGNGR